MGLEYNIKLWIKIKIMDLINSVFVSKITIAQNHRIQSIKIEQCHLSSYFRLQTWDKLNFIL